MVGASDNGSGLARVLRDVSDGFESHAYRRMSQPESRLQRRIRKHLMKVFPGSWWYKVHGNEFTPSGIPDLVGCVEGRFFGLEVKRPEGGPSRIQLVTHERMRASGACVQIVMTCAEAERAVRCALVPQLGDPRLPGRFWAKIQLGKEFEDKGPCWVWTGSGGINSCSAYGFFRVGSQTDGTRRQASVHRYSYEILVGSIPEGFEVDHLCRVTHCANPQHLQPVTGKVNSSRSRSTKLTDEQVAAIREMRKQGWLLGDIGQQFGISRSHVSLLCSDRSTR